MKRNKWSYIVLLLIFGVVSNSSAQKAYEKAYQILPYISYGFDLSMADMKDRFGTNYGIHGGVDVVLKNNYSIGWTLKYKFGNNLKEDVLHELRLESGEILGTDNTYANVVMNQRGLYTGLQVGKLIPMEIGEYNFDIKFDIGAGYQSHYIYIANSFEDVPQLVGDLTKGYDRLTTGLGLNQAISFHYKAPNDWRLFLSLESIQGFTSLARNIQYDQPQTKLNDRVDIMTGLHVGFVLPFGFGSYGEDQKY